MIVCEDWYWWNCWSPLFKLSSCNKNMENK
jgi:hypothetical protein